MTPAKQVSFLERVDKSLLGLEGLQIVVYSDRCRNIDDKIKNQEYNFSKLGKKMINEVNGEFIQSKYKLKPGIEFGRILHTERVRWLKQQEKMNSI